MGIHAIQAFAPNVAVEDAEPRLLHALTAAGRQVRARRPVPLSGGPAWREGALHWEVVQLAGGGTVLRTYDVGAASWDPQFLRALSEASGGFVEGIEHHRNRERYAAATMFAGRTIELAAYDAGTGLSGLGLPADDRLGAARFEDNHQRRFSRMCDFMSESPSSMRVVAAGEWDVSPARERFSADDETATSRAVLGWVEEDAFAEALPGLGAAGWRWRPGNTPQLETPFIELARDGALDRAACARWARAVGAAYVAFELPGAGGPMPFALSYDGEEDHLGQAVGTDELCDALIQLSGMFSEGVGMLFGGDAAWRDIGGPGGP